MSSCRFFAVFNLSAGVAELEHEGLGPAQDFIQFFNHSIRVFAMDCGSKLNGLSLGIGTAEATRPKDLIHYFVCLRTQFPNLPD